MFHVKHPETPKDARHKRFTVRLEARGSDKEMGISGRVPKHPKGKAIFMQFADCLCEVSQ